MAEEEENEKLSKEEEEEEAVATQIQVPEDIINDILLRLPVKSLVRFRCVCKPWCALITDPTFVKIHCSRSLASNSSNLSLMFQGLHVFSVDLDACKQQEAAVELFNPFQSDPYYEVVGSCNGLLCISYSDEDIFLWNPSTRRHQKLPFSPIEITIGSSICYIFDVAYGFGYDPSTEDYKLVRVAAQFGRHSDEYYPVDFEVKVYSLSTNSWKRISGNMPFYSIFAVDFGVLANSILHWVAQCKTGSDFIFYFDLQDDKYGEVPLPDFMDDKFCLPDSEEDEFDMDVGVLGGQLCMLLQFYNVRVEVWVMKEYGVRDSWVKQFSIELPLLERNNPCFKPICYLKNGKVILKMDIDVLVLYDPHIGRAEKLKIRGASDYTFETLAYIESLVPLNAKDGTKHAEKKSRKQSKKKTRQ